MRTDARAESDETVQSDRRAIEAAVDRFEKPLLAYANGMLRDFSAAQDAVQETFLKLCRHRHVAAGDHLAPWLFTVCRTRVIDMRRKKSAGHVDSLEHVAVAPDPTPEQTTIAEEEHRQLASSIGSLTPRQQEVLRLRMQAGLSYVEIAEVTGLTVSNVGFHLHQAVKSLRQTLATT